MTIADPVPQKKKRVESKNIDTCSVNSEPNSGKLALPVDSKNRLVPAQEGVNRTRHNCRPSPNFVTSSSIIDMEEASSVKYGN